MKLLTKEIENYGKKFPFGSQDGTPLMERKVIVKFFNPYGVGTWIITEMEWKEEEKDYLMYGLCDLGGGYELGYVSYNELNSIRLNVFGARLPLEREMYTPCGTLVKELISETELM